jgi:hypothetical protein
MMMNVKTVLAAAIVGLAIVTNANAGLTPDVTYNWVPDTSVPLGDPSASSGQLVYDPNNNTIVNFNFTYDKSIKDTDYNAVGIFGVFVFLSDGDLGLNGYSTNDKGQKLVTWISAGLTPTDEDSANPLLPIFGTPPIFGDWVPETPTGNTVTPVPEPATVIAGALMLLPFSMCVVRALRRNRVM